MAPKFDFDLSEVSFEEAFESGTVACFVAGHFVDGIVDGVEVLGLGAFGDVGFAGAGSELGVDA